MNQFKLICFDAERQCSIRVEHQTEPEYAMDELAARLRLHLLTRNRRIADAFRLPICSGDFSPYDYSQIAQTLLAHDGLPFLVQLDASQDATDVFGPYRIRMFEDHPCETYDRDQAGLLYVLREQWPESTGVPFERAAVFAYLQDKLNRLADATVNRRFFVAHVCDKDGQVIETLDGFVSPQDALETAKGKFPAICW